MFPALLVGPTAAEDGDTDDEEGHGDDYPGPGDVHAHPRGHVSAVVALQTQMVIRQLRY